MTSTHDESNGLISAKFTPYQYQQILDMLNKQDSKTNNTYANTSQLTGILCLSAFDTNIWIRDSGATDHMCNDFNRFTNHSLIEKENHEVIIPNGTKIKIKCKGIVVLQNGITLHNVLFVPRFKYNLISISKMSIDLNCKIFSQLIDALFRKP